jgi:GNAT superfamily N-acetyltransferase
MLGAARVILQHNQKDAEFAVLVGDPWHGRGIGAHLLTTCLDIARERGFRSIWGMVLAENKGMLALGRKLGFPSSVQSQPASSIYTCQALPTGGLPHVQPIGNFRYRQTETTNSHFKERLQNEKFSR